MRRRLIISYFLFSTGAYGAPIEVPNACQAAIKGVLGFAQSTLVEARETKGLSLFLSEAPADTVTTRWGGLLSEVPPPPAGQKKILDVLGNASNAMLQFGPRKVSKVVFGKEHNLTPNKAAENVFRAGTKKFLKKDLVFSNLVKVPVGFYLFGVAYGAMDSQFDKLLTERKHQSFNRTLAHADKLLQTDYRLQGIHSLELSGLSHDQAVQAAKKMLLAYKDYFDYFNSNYAEDYQKDIAQNTHLVRRKLLSHPLFADLDMPRIIKQAAGYVYDKDFREEISDQQRDEMIAARQKMYLKYSLIPWVVKPDLARQIDIQTNPILREYADNLARDPFYRELDRRVKIGKLTRDQMIYRLMEDADWEQRIALWDILKVKRLQRDEANTHWTDKVLTNDDIRRETLADMDQEKP